MNEIDTFIIDPNDYEAAQDLYQQFESAYGTPSGIPEHDDTPPVEGGEETQARLSNDEQLDADWLEDFAGYIHSLMDAVATSPTPDKTRLQLATDILHKASFALEQIYEGLGEPVLTGFYNQCLWKYCQQRRNIEHLENISADAARKGLPPELVESASDRVEIDVFNRVCNALKAATDAWARAFPDSNKQIGTDRNKRYLQYLTNQRISALDWQEAQRVKRLAAIHGANSVITQYAINDAEHTAGEIGQTNLTSSPTPWDTGPLAGNTAPASSSDEPWNK